MVIDLWLKSQHWIYSHGMWRNQHAPFKKISFLCTRTHSLVYLQNCLHSAGYARLCAAATTLSLRSACSVLECSTWYRSILALCNLGPVAEGGQYCRRELLRVDAQFRVISADWGPFPTRARKEEKRHLSWESLLFIVLAHLKIASSLLSTTSHCRTF